MSLTIQPVDLRSGDATAHPPAETRPSDPAAGPPGAERWLEVMYGIRPGVSSRRTSAATTYRHAPTVADWLHRMWGL
jgi:hypothetical protein